MADSFEFAWCRADCGVCAMLEQQMVRLCGKDCAACRRDIRIHLAERRPAITPPPLAEVPALTVTIADERVPWQYAGFSSAAEMRRAIGGVE